MIRYLYASELTHYPDLAADMFRDRAVQFRDRLGWEVQVDALGWETDAYDAMDPLYVLAEDGAGGHAASMRFLPTTGPHMLADVFAGLAGGPVRSGRIWECTRFCLAPGTKTKAARTLLLAASELGLGMGLTHAVGVFDAAMIRVYRRLGWEPEVLGRENGIAVGLWTFAPATHDALARRCGVTHATARAWFEAAFGDLPRGHALPTRA
ncbi:acyl-homoserine-lactone synthase [Jannaschia ovalis]|uniref:Acyl-homoserine-lactone synthase n=1 Tax=Jannaschia ovalis TaxID=3038773 RepID=A0ABY8LFK1_9RHOB|nr:acyl-homoserine-lactone synthase [Jannaschia sp. GRR-S6-38]WGH80062.1 acyl-homoserine-lactone synthase [Jannaschia sp. GRR-S6-38]